MSKLYINVLLLCLSLVSLKNLMKKKLAQHGEPCWSFKWCGGNMTCVDYRCLFPEEKENHTVIEFSPNGPKCNFLHHCVEGYKCVDNYCQFINSNETKEDINSEIEHLFNVTFNISLPINNNTSNNNSISNETLGNNTHLQNNKTKDNNQDNNEDENKDKKDKDENEKDDKDDEKKDESEHTDKKKEKNSKKKNK